MPQDIVVFNCFRIEKNAPNIINDVIIPIAVTTKLFRIFLVSVFKTDNNFIDITGKTHGIKLRIKPPTNAVSIIKTKLLFI